jgi:hypothetical protein
MRIAQIALCSFLALGLVTACGGDKAGDKADKKDDKKDDKKLDEPKPGEPTPEPTPEPKPEAAAVETSPEMTAFLAKFDGTDAAVTSALKEYGANDEIANNDMGMYMLAKPKVVSKEGDCYTFEAEAGITVRTYNVCWAEGKINKVEDKGMR